jgi:hypothetical protein
VAVVRLKPTSVGDYLKLSIDAHGARAKADEVLRSRGVDPNAYRHAVVFVDNTDPLVNEYLRERIGVARLNDIYAHEVPGALWRVRYFRDSEKEEYAVILKPDGSVHSVWHVLAEDTPGAQLSKDAAVSLAEKYLTDVKHLDLSKWKLVGAAADQLPHRVDHTLVWEKTDPLDSAPETGAMPGTATTAGGAHERVRVMVAGDQITRYQTFIKIPEDWTRGRQALNVPRLAVAYGIPAVLCLALAIAMLSIFLRNLKSEAVTSIPWRRVAVWSLWGLLAFFVVFALGDRIANFMNAYNTDQPLKLTLGGLAVGLVIGAPFYFAVITLVFGLAWFFARRAFSEDLLPGWTGMPALYYRDALFIGIGGTAGLLALGRLAQLLVQYWPTPHRQLAAAFGQDFDATLPAASILGTAILRGLLSTGMITAIAGFVAAYVPQKWLRVVFLVAGALALVGGGWGNGADYAKQFVAELVFLGAIALGIRYIAKFNLLGYFLVLTGTTILSGLAELLGQNQPFYRLNGYALIAALAALLAWPLVSWLARGSSVATATG